DGVLGVLAQVGGGLRGEGACHQRMRASAGRGRPPGRSIGTPPPPACPAWATVTAAETLTWKPWPPSTPLRRPPPAIRRRPPAAADPLTLRLAAGPLLRSRMAVGTSPVSRTPGT